MGRNAYSSAPLRFPCDDESEGPFVFVLCVISIGP